MNRATLLSGILSSTVISLAVFLSAAHADITYTGQLDPADPANWDDDTDGYVGKTEDGTLTVTDGSDLYSKAGFIGYDSGINGTVTIDGSGSTWTLHTGYDYIIIPRPPIYVTVTSASSSSIIFDPPFPDFPFPTPSYTPLYVGYSGNGTLNITDGGAVSNSYGYIGYNVGSTGIVTVAGADSTWTNNSSLYIGHSGTGTLNISGGANVSVHDSTYVGYQTGSTGTINFGEGGGTLTTCSLYASAQQLMGEGTINSRGLVSDLDLVFNSTNGLTQTLTFNSLSGQNVTFNLDMSGTSGDVGDLGAGYHDTGSLSILEGVSVASDNGYIGFAAGSTGTGTVNASTWSMSKGLYVGYCGDGSLSISNAATVSNTDAYIGYYTDTTGEVSVAGEGTTWTNSGNLYVGHSGNGTLGITSGSTVINSTGYIGYESGSIGVVNVDGTNTTWTNGGNLYVGYSGNGTLNISGGAVVSVDGSTCVAYQDGSTGSINFGSGSGTLNPQSLMAASAQLSGSGTINTCGLVSDVSLVFNSTTGHTGLAILTDGSTQNITINLDLSGNSSVGDLGVGYRGNGSLTVSEGITINTANGFIGYSSGSTSTAEISGGSTWINSSNLYIGYNGDGSLTITNASTVSNVIGYIGCKSGSTGLVTVEDGSTWTSSGSLYVGQYGDGTLSISNGSTVSNNTCNIGFESGSTGMVTVDGAGSSWNNGGNLLVGCSGNGTLNISGGASVVIDGSTHVGFQEGSTGSINFGTGGGTLTTLSLMASASQLTGSGTINTSGLISDAAIVFNASTGQIGIGAITDGAEQNIAINLDLSGSSGTVYDLGIGYEAAGSLNVSGAVTINSANSYLGYSSGSTGTAAISDGSTWANTGELYVGRNGNGTLTMSGGSTVSNTTGYIGYGSDSTSEVTVSSSTWTNSDKLYVGYSGNGTLNLSNGSSVSNTKCYIGYESGSTGAVTLDGADTSWTNTDRLCVGHSGNGILNISNGSTVSTSGYSSYIGYQANSNGTVTVSGTGSSWTNSGNLYVGYSGNGRLNISGGATVSVDGYTCVANEESASGSINFGEGGGTLSTSMIYATNAQLTGTGTINTCGLYSDDDLVFDSSGLLPKN